MLHNKNNKILFRNRRDLKNNNIQIIYNNNKKKSNNKICIVNLKYFRPRNLSKKIAIISPKNINMIIIAIPHLILIKIIKALICKIEITIIKIPLRISTKIKITIHLFILVIVLNANQVIILKIN